MIATRDRPIYRPYIWVSPIYRYRPKWLGLSRCWQNAVIFLMHPDNLCKEAQRTKPKQYLAATLSGSFT